MRSSLQKRKRWVWVLGITIMILALMCLFVRRGPPFIINGSPAVYTKEELSDLYWANKDEFSKVSEIVLASDAFRQRIIDDYEDDWEIRSESVKGDFTEDDWRTIVDLFKKIRPYMIMRSLRHGDTVYFNFGHQEISGREISTSLYYFKSAVTMEAYKSYIWVGDLEQLDGYWYIGELVTER